MNTDLRSLTPARVGLGRFGSSMPTEQHLRLLEAQALARDSLWRTWDGLALSRYLRECDWPCLNAVSEVRDRQQYLMRPDLGRRLSIGSMYELQQSAIAAAELFDWEIVFCVSDGLSTDAIDRHMQPLLDEFLPRLIKEPFYRQKPYPFVLIPLARVAVGDAVGEALGSRLSVIFVGERPGLSAHDSLGIYLTHEPKIGLLDSKRNCISNIRVPDGLSYAAASEQLLYLLRQSLRLRLSGVELKMDVSPVHLPMMNTKLI